MLAIPARVIATCFMLTCFAGTLCYGIYNGNDTFSVFLDAVIVLIPAYIVGRVVGGIMLRSVNEQIKGYRERNPEPVMPNESTSDQDPGQVAAG